MIRTSSWKHCQDTWFFGLPLWSNLRTVQFHDPYIVLYDLQGFCFTDIHKTGNLNSDRVITSSYLWKPDNWYETYFCQGRELSLLFLHTSRHERTTNVLPCSVWDRYLVNLSIDWSSLCAHDNQGLTKFKEILEKSYSSELICWHMSATWREAW